MTKFTMTLLFLVRGEEVLLAFKKRGFGANRYNGVGGKLDSGETVNQAMTREAQEEIGITPTTYEQVALINFDEFFKGEPAKIEMHIFISNRWQGEPVESEEMAPQWFKKDRLPLDQMWHDDPFWLPQVLQDKKIKAWFKLDERDELVNHKVEEVSGF